MSQAGLGEPLPTFHTADAAATVALGRELALKLVPGDVVAFYGELGAGKTTMIKGVCVGLGVTEVVKSPSFVIATQYQGRLPVYHVDLYRIGKSGTVPDCGAERQGLSRDFPDELAGIDFEGYLEAGGVCLIEWAERAESLLPERAIRVRLSLEGKGRRIEVEEPGPAKAEIK